MQWITDNWVAIIATLGAGVAFAHAIAALTPSKKDDEIVAKIEAVVKGLLTK